MSFTENFENNKNNDSMEYSIEPKFLSLLNKTSNFYVLKPEIRFLPDTEKLMHSIKIDKKSFEKIFSLNQTNFIEILSIAEIVISKLRYEYFHSLLLSRSKYEPRLKRLLKNIESSEHKFELSFSIFRFLLLFYLLYFLSQILF